MKKLLLVLALTTGIAFASNAQDKKLSLGVRAGVNVSSIRADGTIGGYDISDEYDFKSRTGFHVGAVLDWNVCGNFYIQPGLYFTTRGGKAEEADDDYSYEEKWNMSFLQVPILASYRFDLSDKVKWHINAGPYIGVGLGGKVKWEENDMGDTDSGDYDMFGTADDNSDEEKNGLKRFDAGLSFGTGVSFSNVYIGVSYDLGLCNLADKKAWDKAKFKNGNFAVSVGYNF